MTTSSALVYLAAMGLSQVGTEALRLMPLAAGLAVLTAGAYLLRRPRKEPLKLVVLHEACRWCDDPSCIDSTLCDCVAPCGRRYCKAEVACA